MFAVIRTGGKQYKVTSGDVVFVERLAGEAGSIITLDDVLMLVDGDKLTLGDKLKGASVTAEILGQDRAAKIIVFKKKRRANYRRKKGHKQLITVLRVKDIKAA